MAGVVLDNTGPFGVHDNDESGSTYACDCGQEYMNEQSLRKHQQNNCTNRSVQCSFCQQRFPSSSALGDHLQLCGNKTDECPRCGQRILRSHFAYHYENNCAPTDRVETPPPGRPRSRSGQRIPPNYNKPVAREDIPYDDAENYPNQKFSIYPPRANGRIHSPSNSSNSPVTIECEYCHSGCRQNDYQTHKDHCLKNPANINRRQPNQNSPNDIVHVPCEFCNQSVDIRNWSNHTQSCREKDNRRVATLARSISEEPINEKFPCEYCQQLFSPKQLHSHEANCPRNIENMNAAARLANPRPANRVALPIKPKNGERSKSKSRDDVQYHRIDVDRTHEANRQVKNNRSVDRKSTNQYTLRHTPSDEALIHPDGSSENIRLYDNELPRSNNYRSLEDISQHGRSSPNKARNMEKNRDPRSSAKGGRSTYYNDPKYQHKLHQRDGSYEIINNQPGRALTKKRKKAPWYKKFFCGITDGYTTE